MTENDDDLALQTLLAVRAEFAPELDEQLLRSCYAVEKKNQFNQDRFTSIQALDRLIEERVDALLAGGTEKGAAR